MLRASVEHTGQSINLKSIRQSPALDIATELEHGDALLALTDALIAGEPGEFSAHRDRAVALLGDVFTGRAIGVASNFQMMNRLLDATGMPVQRRFQAIDTELG